MPRLTVASLKTAANWAQVLNLDTTDSRWLIYLNECLERFSHMALWDRLIARYQICVNQACITWPRSIMTLEVVDICKQPVPVHNGWFEFLENGPGRISIGSCSGTSNGGCSTEMSVGYGAIDRGRGFAMFDDPTVASKIRLYPQLAGDVGKTVTIRGFDSNGQQVLTNAGSTVGEVLTLALPFVDSSTTWCRQVFREVIKQVTLGHVKAYSYDATLPVPPASPGPNDTPLLALADWEPDETLPDYRRSFIPSLSLNCGGTCGCSDSSNGCDKTTVTVMAKLNHIPVTSDLDFLPFSSVSALKLGMLSVMLEERQDWVGARAAMFGTFDPIRKKYVGGAVPLLEDELDAFQGAGTVATLRLESGETDRARLTNLI